MIKNPDAFIAHLKRTGRMKLLPQILRELKAEQLLAAKRAPRMETAKDHPELLSGWRKFENGMLTDMTGKRALIDIYRKITS